MAQELQQLIVDTLNTQSVIEDTRTLIPNHDESVLSALNSLNSREIVTYETHETLQSIPTPEGSQILSQGSHEIRVFQALSSDTPLSVQDLQKAIGAESAKIGQGRAFKNGWIRKSADGKGFLRAKGEAEVKDETQLLLQGLDKISEKEVADLKKRKLVVQKKSSWFKVGKGKEFSVNLEKPQTDLTDEMLVSGAWKTNTFKKYNFEAEGVPTSGGSLHPLLKVKEELRGFFMEMGFAEMPTQSFVETGFWNFDAMFVPQQHPARDMQDTFHISDPATALPPLKEYYDRVAKVHEHGDADIGSIGYRAKWVEEESRKLVLRTHTTASSTAMLYKLAAMCRGEKPEGDEKEFTHGGKIEPGNVADDGFRPAKLFSIDRVFRNETMDATHLAEFHQVEGVVADRNLTLADLIGFMRVFFKKMGIENVRFKPAYNPYTEPSLEIFAFHPMLNKWVEVGNSGMFRPEMLEPMGYPKDVRVHGWGLSLERPTMIRYGINNIRTLVGHKVNLESVEQTPAVMF